LKHKNAARWPSANSAIGTTVTGKESETSEPAGYVGRFAPSPTGPLHFGSLVAAVASYLDARSNAGQWLLRIEDIDPPREQQGASSRIVDALQRYGFEWDGEIIYQSQNDDAHRSAVARLVELDLAYRCRCSRRTLADEPRGPLGTIYPGTCRNGCEAGEAAIRVITNDKAIEVSDALQGPISQRLESQSGDFVIRRRDGLIAYQLAVVVDDHLQGITDIVRGIDIIDSTPRQVWLQHLLGYDTPRYKHIPVITHPNGDKLSKLTGAEAIPLDAIESTLVKALAILGQKPPAGLGQKKLPEIWNWAFEHWKIDRLYGQRAIVNAP
jgi:glutamyl-Q tRNA(Asp) synthetase